MEPLGLHTAENALAEYNANFVFVCKGEWCKLSTYVCKLRNQTMRFELNKAVIFKRIV